MQGCPIFKLKQDAEGNPSCFKAHYICRGYTAIFSQDYSKTSLPTAHLESFRILTHLGAALDWETEQLDIKTAYLNGVLAPDEVCYMEQPEGFVEPGHKDWVWELQKGLYGMKQSGHMWNESLHLQMMNWKLHRLEHEYCIYYCELNGEIIIVAIHVDDFFMVGNSQDTLTHFCHQLQSVWQICIGCWRCPFLCGHCLIMQS